MKSEPRLASSSNSLLFEILSQPTAPFREAHVIKTVTDALTQNHVPWMQDTAGNVVVGVSSRAELKRLIQTPSKEPLRVFIAHMDHPGLVGTEWVSPTRLKMQWLGRGPTEHLSGAKLWTADQNGYLTEAKLLTSEFSQGAEKIDVAEVEWESPLTPQPLAKDVFAGLGFRSPVWMDDKLIYTKAADDLVGVYAIVELAIRKLRKRARAKPSFIGLLTRAEEVGFVGMMAHLEEGLSERAKREVVYLSIECSMTLPGAEIGKGPVVRVGDRMTAFHPGYTQLFKKLATRVLPGAHQARVMDGGRCEASAVTAWGQAAIGISVPLGNYHNLNRQGGPDCGPPNGPGPEFVHIDDVRGVVTLLEALIQPGHPWKAPWAETKRELKALYAGYRHRLRDPVGFRPQ